MKSLCFVFSVPSHYFDDMVAACVRLHRFYQNPDVRPLYVSTMKRSYCFENGRGKYGEFECGDRFLIFQGEPGAFAPDSLFRGTFPTSDALRQAVWEGHDLQVGMVEVDDVLAQDLERLGIAINPFSENEWMQVEDYTSLPTLSHTNRESFL